MEVEMSDFLMDWFEWFEEGISSLDQKSKESFFSKCSSNCVKRGVAEIYRNHYIESNSNLDQFFSRLAEKGHAQGKILRSGIEYEMSYSQCTCELYKLGYVNSGFLCECSRQSIFNVMKLINPDQDIEVEILSTILRGSKECCFRIIVK